ncbi:MAG: aminoglycoside phosphotransferase family protein [Clostridia bacterium]|nr:aminoglycoside phosphotransferase family protein [Clostridia bacterium]
MKEECLIKNAVNKKTGYIVDNISPIGNGASGSVYHVFFNNNNSIAVKISKHPELIKKEFEMLLYLKEKTASKIPDVYFFDEDEGYGIIAMEYINGISGTDKSLKFRFNKKHLAESIVNNLITIQQAHNDKFGPFDNAVYDTWQEYYKLFADEIYTFSKHMHTENKLDNVVMKAVKLSYENFDKIFEDEIKQPTLIHGDYWMPNFIIDKKTTELLSVVDPFNVMWADPEYELFALTVGFGKKLRLYELYKSKVRTSKYCDVKLEMYALYSELLWYKKLGSITHSYLKMRSKKLIKQLKKNSII